MLVQLVGFSHVTLLAFLTHNALGAGWEMTSQHQGSEILWDLRQLQSSPHVS